MLFGHRSKVPLAAQPTILHNMRVQTSSYGDVVPIVFGQNRVSGKLLWYGDFTPISHVSTQNVGGKGLGGGQHQQQTTTYTYQSAVAILLCEGSIQGLYNVWDTKGKIAQLTATENYTIPTGGGTYTVSNNPNYYDDFGVGRNDNYSVNANDYGDIPRTYTGTYRTRMSPVGSSPGTGQYSRSGGSYTFSSGDQGKTVAITYTYTVPDTSSNGQATQILSLSLFKGAQGQTAWPYLTTNHPGQDIGYSNCAYVASQNMDLGTSGSLPNYTYEVIGLSPFGAGYTDANPADVITTLFTNTRIGVGIPSQYLGSLTQYSNYCVANSLFMSPVLDSQRPARDIISDFLEGTNSAAFWSEGVLKIVPYGDTTCIGNGVTYTPNTTPIVDLTDDDYIEVKNGDAITINRPNYQDAENSVKIEWVNRSNSYNTEVVEEKDQNAIEQYGYRPGTSKSHHFWTTLTGAQFAANTLLKRQVYIRKKYQFSIGWRYCFLEPMDLVTLTDSRLGLSKTPARITEIEEQEDGTLKITAEEFPWGTATATLYAKQTPSSYSPQADADPGQVNTPIIYEPTARATQYGGYEIWLGVSGQNMANWGGCFVYISADGTTYKKIGQINGAARMGTLTATLANTADPDTTDTCSVDLTQSQGTLLSGSASDCDNFRTLCLVGTELISYQNATLTSTYHYNLATRLRRGVFGSTVASHASGSVFMRIDDAVFKYQYDPQWVGQTIHLKFVSFNTVGGKLQNLSNVTDYTFAISGVPGSIDQATGHYTGNLDTIADGSQFVKILASHAAGNIAYNFRGVWSNTTAYFKGDEVISGTTYWVAAANNTGSAPSTSNANWTAAGSYAAYQGAWSSTTAYVAGDEVTFSGNYWICVTGNTNSAPSTSNANWALAGPQTLDNLPNGTRAAWDSTTQKGAAVDSSGNLKLKNISQAVGSTSNPSSTSSTYATIPEMSVTVTTKGNPVFLSFSGYLWSQATNGNFAIFRDGTQITIDLIIHSDSTSSNDAIFIDSVAAGSHTYDVRWKQGDLSTVNHGVTTARTLQVVELG